MIKKRIGLIDVDGHNFPNLALMRIAAYHKAKGDIVEWWWGWDHYDIVYKSKIFSDEYSPDIPDPVNADKIVKGGTGYAINLVNDKEVYDKSKDPDLPPEIERMKPDYSIYPQYDFAVSMTSRGCPRGCAFCHVQAKEGKCSVKVANVEDFYEGQKLIKVLDPNITACPDKRDLFAQYISTGAKIDFTQGLDIRCINGADIEDLNRMRLDNLHFAWDDPRENLEAKFADYARNAHHKPHGDYATVYVLTNYNSTLDEDLYRIYTLRDMGYLPDVRIYNKPNAPMKIRRLQRWCNNRAIFKTTPNFKNYRGG